MKNIEEKINIRLQKPFFTDMMILAASTGINQKDYLEKVKKLGIFLREKLEERGLIKKLTYRPKQFWKFEGKKKIYNIDGGQLSLSVTGSAALGIRIGVYRVKPGDYSKNREDSDESTTLVSNITDKSSSHYDQDEDSFMIKYNKMITGTRMIMEASEVVKQTNGQGKWKEKPNKEDIIFLHGPIVYEATMYHLADTEGPIPPFKSDFCKKILSHAPNFHIDQFKINPNELKTNLRYFLPLYCEITSQIQKSQIPTYGVVERSGGLSSPGPVTRSVLGELYHEKERRKWISQRNLKDSWDVKVAGDKGDSKMMTEEFTKRPLSDSVLFDLILDEGEYIQPVQIIKNYEQKWPREYMSFLDYMPEPFSTFLKVSELKQPIKIETLKVLSSYDDDIDFTYHSSKLLPEYCFPLGLDIIDKITKVPSWMRNSMRNEYQREVIRKTMETNNSEYIKLALKSLIPNRNGWNRP